MYGWLLVENAFVIFFCNKILKLHWALCFLEMSQGIVDMKIKAYQTFHFSGWSLKLKLVPLMFWLKGLLNRTEVVNKPMFVCCKYTIKMGRIWVTELRSFALMMMMMINNLGGLDISGKSNIAGKAWTYKGVGKSTQYYREKKQQKNGLYLSQLP